MDNYEMIQKIEDFIKAGDDSDLQLLEKTLHRDYRNVQIGFFEKKGLFNFDKREYKALIQKGTFGGVPRKMEIKQMEVLENMAYARVSLQSDFLLFESLITLVKEQGVWWVIGNYPSINQL